MKKIIISAAICFFLFLTLASSIEAKSVAMIVKDSTSLSSLYEKKIKNILTDMGLNVTLVDKNTAVNYNDFDLIVVAGRPSTASSSDMLDSFVKDIPVNDVPTLAIDSQFVGDWGWVDVSGLSSLSSNQPQKVLIKATHPLTQGFSLDQLVQVHVTSGYNTIDLEKDYTKLKIVASVDYAGKYGSILYGNPNTALYNQKSVSGHSAVVFFGTTYPYYWTDEAADLFKNSVNWLLNMNFTPPVAPVLSGPASSRNPTALYQWTSSSDIQYYKFQLSTSPNFTTTLIDINTTSLQYSATVADGQTYYARVKAVNWIDVWSEWSNTIKTIADFSDLTVSIISPSENSTFKVGDSIFVNATVNSGRPIASCSVLINGQETDLIFANSSCSGSVSMPNIPAGQTNLTVSATNSLGSTNSSVVFISVQAPASSSSDSTSPAPVYTGGGSVVAGSTALTFSVPLEVTGYAGEKVDFNAVVRNFWSTTLKSVKVKLNGMSAPYTIVPEQTDVPGDSSQAFVVSIDIPKDFSGKYDIEAALSTSRSYIPKHVILNVLPQRNLIPVVTATDVLIPSFTSDEPTKVGIKLKNVGNATARVSETALYPDEWKFSVNSFYVELEPNNEQIVSFDVTPYKNSGTISFVTSYDSDGNKISFTKTADVSVNVKQQESSFTGLFSAVSDPIVALPVAAALVFLGYTFFRFGLGKKSFIDEQLIPRTPKVTMHSISSINPAYKRWENKYRK
jgi:hypothetical protein